MLAEGVLKRWDVDRAVFYAVAARAWQFPAGLVTVLLIAEFFTPAVQGYYYTAKQLMGLVFIFLGELGRGWDLLAQARDLKRRFNEAFWMPEAGFYALALGPEKAQLKSIASNAGRSVILAITGTASLPNLTRAGSEVSTLTFASPTSAAWDS